MGCALAFKGWGVHFGFGPNVGTGPEAAQEEWEEEEAACRKEPETTVIGFSERCRRLYRVYIEP